MREVLSRLANLHDRITSASFALAQFCLLVIVFSYAYETVSRYFFAAPTWWSNEVVAYALCIGTFLAFPEVTRRGGHIAITFVLDSLTGRGVHAVKLAIAVVSGLACLFVAWICFEANIQHFIRDEMMVRVRPIPKIWLSVWLTYGFASSGIHFLRLAAEPRPATA